MNGLQGGKVMKKKLTEQINQWQCKRPYLDHGSNKYIVKNCDFHKVIEIEHFLNIG